MNVLSATPHATTLSAFSSNRNRAVLALLLLGIACFYALTVRPGNFWADDYALYIHHAENIAEGRPYADTGFIYNPAVSDYSPRAYPPVFPLLLAPVYRAFGFNFVAMKFEIVIFFVLALVVLTMYWRNNLRFPYLLALLAIVGWSPIFWTFKDSVVADIPFLFFFFLTAWIAEIAPRDTSAWWIWALATGTLLYLSAGTRTIGLTLIPGLILYELITRRGKSTRLLIIAVVTCGALLLMQRSLLGSGEQSYADQLHPTLSSLLFNAKQYPHEFMMLWTRSLGVGVSVALFLTTTAIACYGLTVHLKRRVSAVDAFLIPYLGMVILWPAPQGMRFLLPLIPYYVYLVLLGLQELPTLIPLRWSQIAGVSILSLIAASYAVAFRHASYGTIQQADGRPSFNNLCDFIRDRTSQRDVFIFRRSRALSLFTSRPAAIYDPRRGSHLAAFLTSTHANYIVSSTMFEDDRNILIPFIRSHPTLLTEVYENSDFQVYRIVDGSPSACVANCNSTLRPESP